MTPWRMLAGACLGLPLCCLLAALLTSVAHRNGWVGSTTLAHSLGSASTPNSTTPKTGEDGSTSTPHIIEGVKVEGGDGRSSQEEAYVVPVKKRPHPSHRGSGADSGEFRGKLAEWWDTHPEYEFSAFGRSFHLLLEHGHTFAIPNLKVTQVWGNETMEEEPGLRPEGCFYTGALQGDPLSAVVVNLCHGMTGHIRTSEGSYLIQPAEPWGGTAPLRHLLTRLAPASAPCHADTDSSERTKPRGFEGDSEEEEDEEELEARRRSEEHRRRRRSAATAQPQEYFIELMVVADKKMFDYHGENLNTYILTLMSIVARVFKDASIGNPMSLALVKLYVMKDRDFFVRTRTNSRVSATTMLRTFCDWQHRYNFNDDSPYHHDTALLLTRESICRDLNPMNLEKHKCETLGLAELGTMCDQFSSCALVRDNGLSAAFTIAHELGHVLNMPHDDDHKCAPYMEMQGSTNVMARVLDDKSNPWFWSNCSRHFLTDFLEAGYGFCLQDHPLRNDLKKIEDNRLPGEDFPKDKQCELVYGEGFKICPFMPPCKHLFCIAAAKGEVVCRTHHMPWADGTRCAPGRWCQQGGCVPVDRTALTPVNGGWAPWHNYGECSRTCGGGVKKALRHCNNPPPSKGGRYCVGRRVKYKSCNTKDCPPGSPDFREQQCAKFNNNNFNNPNVSKDVKWVPKYEGVRSEDRCKLYCRVMQSSQYYPLKDKVIDGTVCSPDTFDICINGVCHAAGCDHILNSTTHLDICGKCGGDNSTCEHVRGDYNIVQYGYTAVVRIPAGSSNLDIRQYGYNNTNKDDNYLALLDSETGEYILNGNFVVSPFTKLILYGGTKLGYSGSTAVIERINSSQPLTKDLVVEVLSVGNLYPPNIEYQYTVQKDSLIQYTWELTANWGPCNNLCNGEEQREVKCVKIIGGEEVHGEMCKNSPKPNLPVRPCNTHCNFKWEIASESECSSHCGPGIKSLKFHCVQVTSSPTLFSHPVDDASCSHLQLLSSTKSCIGPCNETRWNYSEWGQCSASCDMGIQTREAFCVDKHNRFKDDIDCQNIEKVIKKECYVQKCPYWETGAWTPCSVTCGSGHRERPYWCQGEATSVSANDCPQAAKPVAREPCVSGPCPNWITHAWTECSVTCGSGEEVREVVCSLPMQCNNITKPESRRPCMRAPCLLSRENEINSIAHHRYIWRSRGWTMCSVTCGVGQRKLEMECYDEASGKVTEKERCRELERPKESETCTAPECPRWAPGPWGPCSAIQGQGIETRTVKCVRYDDKEEVGFLCTSPKPEETRSCNVETTLHKSHRQWIVGKWSECSVLCGGGVKRRQVTCDVGYMCEGRKPISSMSCNPDPCTEGVWNFSPWSECSATCGLGQKSRRVWCESKGGLGLSDEDCAPKLQPHSVETCHRPACPRRFHWQFLRWSPCSQTCGRAVKTRKVYCASAAGEPVDDRYCRKRRPRDKAVCDISLPTCHYDWHEEPWSQCSVTCGRGKERRKVLCWELRPDTLTHHQVKEELCDASTRPEETRDCKPRSCHHHGDIRWEPGPWQQCTQPCSKKGRQIRKLYCFKGSKKVRRKECPKELQPERRRRCPPEKCASCEALQRIMGVTKDGEYNLLVEGRTVSVYCSRMLTSRPVEYLSLRSGPAENYAEIYDKRLKDANTCPEKGNRIEHCNCMKITDKHSGFTSFIKIRLNITTLIVDRSDFAFAKFVRGARVSYGEAGDCYSRAFCPQGQFSIDLSGTGFRVHPSVVWARSGQHAFHSVITSHDRTKVVGKCGGYCGSCRPEKELRLDILPP